MDCYRSVSKNFFYRVFKTLTLKTLQKHFLNKLFLPATPSLSSTTTNPIPIPLLYLHVITNLTPVFLETRTKLPSRGDWPSEGNKLQNHFNLEYAYDTRDSNPVEWNETFRTCSDPFAQEFLNLSPEILVEWIAPDLFLRLHLNM